LAPTRLALGAAPRTAASAAWRRIIVGVLVGDLGLLIILLVLSIALGATATRTRTASARAWALLAVVRVAVAACPLGAFAENRVDQVGLAQASEALQADLVGDLVQVGE
jgi:hypothetical protein